MIALTIIAVLAGGAIMFLGLLGALAAEGNGGYTILLIPAGMIPFFGGIGYLGHRLYQAAWGAS